MSVERAIGNRMADLLRQMSGVFPGQFRDKDKVDAVLEEWKLATAPSKKTHASLKECLRDMLYNEEDDEVDIYQLSAKNWPNAKDESGEDAGSLDMENYEFLELTDTKLRMSCGGDWQNPMIIEMELVNGELTVTKAKEDEEWKSGMDEDEFKKLLLK